MTRFFPLLVALLLAVALLAGCDNSDVDPVGGGDLASTLAAADDFEILAQALTEVPAVRSTLAGPGPYTLFAPTDDAFTYVGASTQAALFASANRALLERILRHHVVPGRLTAADLTDGAALTTLDGTTLHVRREGEVIYVDDAKVEVETLTEADNGVVFPINDVLRANLDLASRLLLVPIAGDFVQYATQTGTLAALGGEAEFTVLAPIDAAFGRLNATALSLLTQAENADVLRRLIGFHVLLGRVDLASLDSGAELETLDGATVTFTREDGTLRLDGRRVVSDPAETANGPIYLLDALLFDDFTLDERLRISPTLSTYEYEVRQRPDLVARLAGPDEYTVFAFTNAGYDSLPLEIREALDEPANAALRNRLVRYHVVPGRFPGDALVDGQELVTIDGYTLTVQRAGSDLFIGERLVTETDLPASNGLLYRMGGAMLPPGDLIDTAILRGFTIHVQALRHAGVDALFRQDGPHSLFVFPNEVYDTNPALFSRSDLAEILLYHAAEGRLSPLHHNQTFDPLHGPRRTIAFAPPPLDSYVLDGITPIGLLFATDNGELYLSDGFLVPPAPLTPPLTR